ncbi:MAG: polymer-forming cytoskeletal protein [Clostridia bacterium]|nr:polymer-forming cytoskeletal protein [Clostridia bacterium]
MKRTTTAVSTTSVSPDQRAVSTIIGEDTVIGGTITVENSIRIEGSIIGSVTANGTVTISQNGKITGNVVAGNMVVAGTIEGDMWVKEKVTAESTGKIFGDITTKKLTIAEDALFQGMSIMSREVEAPDLEKLTANSAQPKIENGKVQPQNSSKIPAGIEKNAVNEHAQQSQKESPKDEKGKLSKWGKE